MSDDWDDWFRYKTLYDLHYKDSESEQHHLGQVKIGSIGLKEGRPDLPSSFETLDPKFFSLGQDDSYYENLMALDVPTRDAILSAIRDVAVDLVLFERVVNEDVMQVSLLRSVSAITVKGQYHRMLRGEPPLTPYQFAYRSMSGGNAPIELTFDVQPYSQPPSNVHVLIGRNGAGKTYLLNEMARALVTPVGEAGESISGSFTDQSPFGTRENLFANVVSVTFSAFDPFEPLRERETLGGVRYQYVGLKSPQLFQVPEPKPVKTPDELVDEFAGCLSRSPMRPKLERWQRAITTLEADPNFNRASIRALALIEDPNELNAKASATFRGLSSGHKIVLLTLTRLVDLVDERTLVLFDEPEAHLHPPLLSAFVRAISELLVQRNAVAVIATHSPVVLQEVPRTCVWNLRRVGDVGVAERPAIETFGEDVGTLTHHVFGLEVTDTGFHRLLRDEIARGAGYDEIRQRFNDQLGAEARAIVRGLVTLRDRGVDQAEER